MNHFDKNIELIEQKELPDFIRPFELEDRDLTYVGTDHDGAKIFFDPEKGPILIDGQMDQNYLPNANLKQMVFFFGIASLREIVEVSQYAHPETLFVIIEPLPFFLMHALNEEDFSLLKNLNYIIITEKNSNLEQSFSFLFSSYLFLRAKKPIFYMNSYYRQHDGDVVKKYIQEIGTELRHKFFTIGNSIHDSLIGLVNNFQNINTLIQNPNVANMKNIFKGCPAFVVSAGPSLDKNIEHLKRVGNTGIIIAVDTIVEKLINNGVRPHFICTVEREAIVWDYFYDKQKYPQELYLVAPPVVDPRIAGKFSDRAILPMRQTVREYFWLAEMLGLSEDDFVWMGASCAHLALGMAIHLGASPIVLVGQDLAFGGEKSHANGTIYENKPVASDETGVMVPGYYGGEVPTRKVWFEFKLLFEKKIGLISNQVINATEGGARIEGTLQQPLSEVIDQYCKHDLDVIGVLKNLPKNTISFLNVQNNLRQYIKSLEDYQIQVSDHLDKLTQILEQWSDTMPPKRVEAIYQIMTKTDVFLQEIRSNQLLHHNIQGPLAVMMQKFYTIEQNDSMDSLKQNLMVQMELCNMVENTAWLITQVINENFPLSAEKE